MAALDMSLMERAEPHFCDAFATYDRGDSDLVRTAQEITMAGKMAGFTKNGQQKMLDYLYGFDASDKADEERDRALVDQLIADTQLYDSAKVIKELLEFTVRLRHIAPFNAMASAYPEAGAEFCGSSKGLVGAFSSTPEGPCAPASGLAEF